MDELEGDAAAATATRPNLRRAEQVPKALAAATVLGLTAYLTLQGVSHAEERVFVRFHDVPRWVDHLLWLPMQAGSAWAPVVAAVIGWYVTRSWRPTVGALVVGWSGWVLAKGVKVLVGRGRPWEELGSDLVRASAPSEGLGFVSGHTTVAFACAAVLAPYLSRKWRAVGYALATVVALGRVIVGAHFPLDVVGGASLGLLLAYLWHLSVGIPQDDAAS